MWEKTINTFSYIHTHTHTGRHRHTVASLVLQVGKPHWKNRLNCAKKCSRGQMEANACWYMRVKSSFPPQLRGEETRELPEKSQVTEEKGRERRDVRQRGTETESLLCCLLTKEGFRAEMSQCTQWNTHYDWEVTNMQSRAQLYQRSYWQRLTHAQQMYRNQHIQLFCSSVTSLEQNSSKLTLSVKTERTKAGPGPGLPLMLMFILLIKGSLLTHTFGSNRCWCVSTALH